MELDILKPSQRTYKVVNQIPRFVGEESYAESFGEQWVLFPKTQLDSYTGVPISEKRLRRCLGEDLWNSLPQSLVLECGCGAGRFTEILLKQGARLASVDLSHAVEVNKKNFPIAKNHFVGQADILNLPFIEDQFDIVICLGVLQHTPNPAETIQKLYEQVKPGGYLVIDQYIFTRSYLSLRLLYRQILKRMSYQTSFQVLKNATKIFLPLHKKFRNSKFASIVLNRVSPLVTYYQTFPELNDKLQEEWALLDSFDSLTDWHKNFGTTEKLKNYLETAGFSNIEMTKGGNGIEARAMKITI